MKTIEAGDQFCETILRNYILRGESKYLALMENNKSSFVERFSDSHNNFFHFLPQVFSIFLQKSLLLPAKENKTNI